MGIVLSILIFATLACGFMKSRMEQDSYEELKQRIKSWWVIIGLLFAVLLSGTTLSIIFFAFLSFLALKEFLSIVPMRPVDRKVIFLGVFIYSTAILLGVNRVVRYVYCVYTCVCLFVFAHAYGVNWGYQGLYSIGWDCALGLYVDSL